MATYEPTGLLLSSESQNHPALAEYVELAHDMLGLNDSAVVDGDLAARLSRAVALQVNHLVALGTDASVLSSVTRGARSKVFRFRGNLYISPIAQSIVSSVYSSNTNADAEFPTVRSTRRAL